MMPISAPTDRAPKRDGQAGFTLLEVVLAMLIMSMLATLALPYFRPGASVAVVKAKAFEIASLLRRDRNTTVRFGGASSISVNTKAGVIGSERLHQSVRVPDGVSLRILPEGLGSVSFLADGGSSGARIILASRSSTITIDINRVTAAIQIVGRR